MGDGDITKGIPPSKADTGLDEIVRELARIPAAEAWRAPGESFAAGRHVVKGLLGSGGQKMVFLVHDGVLDRDCALSVIHGAELATPQLERFRLEAQALARSGGHPNVVTIHDLGDEEGRPYVLCEYLEGGDLRALLSAGPPPLERSLEIVRDVCLGLAFAHEHGVIHRDVKPANIWLTRDGRAKLGDFGLARIVDQARLTMPGDVLGTAAYMPPEQALGRELDARGDLYALGCVLYELVTGAPPFSGVTPLAVAQQHVDAPPPPPADRRPGLPAGVERLLLRLLAKRPDARPQDAREVAGELDRLIADERGDPAAARERERLAALHASSILDTPREPVYDDLAELAAQICECPIGFVSFIDETRQWMKAACGMPPGLTSVPREMGVCVTTICQGDVLVAPDLAADERFRDLPVVKDEPHFRFYCGAPIITPAGHALGTVCVMDFVPRQLTFAQVEAVRRLARQALAHLELLHTSAELERARDELQRARSEASLASQRADQALRTALPAAIAAELLTGQRVAPRYHASVTVGMIDFTGFARLAARSEPARLLETLDELFSTFDDIVRRRGLEKLRTFGDAYLFAGGLPEPSRRHAIDACLGALELLAAVRRVNAQRERLRLPPWEARVGLHTGPAIAGVVGRWRPGFAVWGEAMSVAARLRAAGEPGRILVSETTHRRVKELFSCAPGRPVEIEDRGAVETCVLEGIKPELARDPGGLVPGERFHQRVAAVLGAGGGG